MKILSESVIEIEIEIEIEINVESEIEGLDLYQSPKERDFLRTIFQMSV